MKHQLIIFIVLLLLLCMICISNIVAIEEEVRVEKEGARSSSPQDDTSSTKARMNMRTEGKSKKLSKRKSKKNIWKKFMKGFKEYQNDWLDNSWFQSPLSRNNFFDDFDNTFSNFDQNFNSMRRRMNNMMRRSNMLPSLFDDSLSFWEDYTNSFNSMNNNNHQKISSSSSTSSSSSESSLITETSDKPMKRRGPISSVIRTINQDGKNELSLDINNIPRDVFEKKDIDIKIKENSLGDLITISGEKKTENGHFQFSKSFRFPKGSLDLDKVKASLSDEGTLSVKIPRVGEPEIKERVKEIAIE